MQDISAENTTFFKQILEELITSKQHDLDVIRRKIESYREKAEKLTVDNSAYAKQEALKGYMLEYVKVYNEVKNLIKQRQS